MNGRMAAEDPSRTSRGPRRGWPWLNPGDRIALVAVGVLLALLLGLRVAVRAGVGTPAAELHRAALTGHRVDINTAPWWELQALQGIGEVRARGIVEHRERHGPFRAVDDFVRVPGIGPKTLERLRPHLTATRRAEGDEEG